MPEYVSYPVKDKMPMSRSKRSSKIIYIVFLLFILMVIVKSYFALNFMNPIVVPDEVVYSNIAKNILSGKFTTDIQFTPTYPPAYPLFLSIATVFADKQLVYYLMLVINAILNSSIIFPAYFIFKKFIDDEYALYFSFAASLLPSVVNYSPFIMSENLFSPLLLFSAWFMLESISRKSLLSDFLFGFSLFLLFFTRTIGIILMAGIPIAIFYKIKFSKQKKYRDILKNVSVMLASSILPLIAWYIYKINVKVPNLSLAEFSDVSGGYSISAYINTLAQAFSSLPSILEFLTLFIHEIDYLVLATYLAFLVFAVYSVFKVTSHKKKPEYSAFIYYTVLSSFLLVLITTVHMYSAVQLGFDRYNIFGRYIDPAAAPIFIMGVLGFYQLKETRERHASILVTDSYLLAGLCLLLFFTFILTLPYSYMIPQANLFLSTYLAAFDIPPQIFAIACLLLFAFMLLIPKNSTFLTTLLLFLFVAFILIDSVIIMLPYSNSTETSEGYPIARYLQNHASSQTLTLFDSQQLSDEESLIWFPINFWSETRLALYQLNDPAACPAVKADYLISNKTLSYPYVNVTSDGDYNLYRIKSC